MRPGNVLLSGIVGSTAYGLATEHSDIDRLGMFAAPTVQFHGLHRPKESHVTTNPDATYHEAGKALRLILSCNPTASEILWLREYEVRTPLGDELIAIRRKLLHRQGVRNAYLGYATQQFRKLKAKGDFGSDVPKTRIEKHARHVARLLLQAELLHVWGELIVRLPDPEHIRRLGQEIARDPAIAEDLIDRAERIFDKVPGVLPERPDEEAAEAWLRRVRRAHWTEQEGT